MKPDWQNKSFAKGGAATGPSTMHSKLKVGMSSLHSKIGVANSNMPKASKPTVRKFADGGEVRTRSDEEIGDTNLRTGVVTPGSFEARMAQGEKNLASLKDAWNKFTGKGGEAKSSNVTGESGMSESDMAKKQAMSGGAQMPTEEKTRQISDYMAKAPESEGADYGNEGNRTSMERSASTVTKVKKPSASGDAQAPKTEVKMTGSPEMPSTKESVAPSKAAPVSSAPVGKPYRTMGGKMARATPEVETPLDQQWGLHNVVPNAKYYAGQAAKAAGAAAEAIKNFETPAERRSRLAKEGK